MKLSSSWLREWLRRTMLNDQNIVQALEQAGIEIEQVISSKEIDKRVVVALVKNVVQHPGAERLKLVEVEAGEGEAHIVCGAPNVKAGMKVALAQIGASLPGGERIEKVKLRGEVSEGMLCSELELGLGNDHTGILELSNDAVVGTPLCDLYPADTVIDIKTPANRFDVLSVYGLAREVSAMTGAPLEPLSPPVVQISQTKGPVVEEAPLARRYMLAHLKLGEAAPPSSAASAWLRSSGMRSLGPVVDATNLTMLEVGQPLHAFDAHKVSLPIAVRMARAGERLTTLDGVERTLSSEDLIIADQNGPIALAGVMGGKDSEVSASTQEILLESAVFDAATVRKMAKRHGLRTEASARFERGLPLALPALGLARAVEILKKSSSAKVLGATDVTTSEDEHQTIKLSLPKLVSLLGFEISAQEAVEVLAKLQIPAVVEKHKGEETIVVTEVPWWRTDLVLAEDLVEEIVRVVGYDKVPATIPSWRPKVVHFDRVRSKRRRVRDLLYASGMFEITTYSFVSAEQLEQAGFELDRHLKLKNPLSSEQAYLRSSLLPSHMMVASRNRTYARTMSFYEISNVFVPRKRGDQPDEPLRLGVTIVRPDEAFRHAKGVLDLLADEMNVALVVTPDERTGFAPGRYGSVVLDGNVVGGIGELHPDRTRALKLEGSLAYFEIDLGALLAASSHRSYAGGLRFPTISRDVAVLVPDAVTWQMIKETLSSEQVAFVSDYTGEELPEGMRSVTLRLTLAHPERTPTEAEAAALESRVVKQLERKLSITTRS